VDSIIASRVTSWNLLDRRGAQTRRQQLVRAIERVEHGPARLDTWRVEPPEDKHEQEDAVLSSLLSVLGGYGVTATVVERPDRLQPEARRFDLVTCDALVDCGLGPLWAVDVMSVTAHADLVAVPFALEARLRPFAQSRGLRIDVVGFAPGMADADAFAAEVRDAVHGEEGEAQPREDLHVRWWPVRDSEEPDVYFAGGRQQEDPLLSNQIKEQIERPLIKKATRQARAAREAGCRTAVLLDQVGHRGIRQGPQWLPQHPHTFEVSVAEVLATVEGCYLDVVLLRNTKDEWYTLWQGGPNLCPFS